jgi:GNAT superfamily N-acetyltransferase
MSITPLRDPPAAPAGLRIVPVDSPQTLADFQLAAFAGFGFPAALGARFLTARLLDSPETALLVGYLGGEVGGEPVATSMLMATGRVAGIYWVATIEAQRRKGYAEALTWAALAAGRSRGCTIGSLQASVLGRPVYARMGFEQTAEYVHFQRPATG